MADIALKAYLDLRDPNLIGSWVMAVSLVEVIMQGLRFLIEVYFAVLFVNLLITYVCRKATSNKQRQDFTLEAHSAKPSFA